MPGRQGDFIASWDRSYYKNLNDLLANFESNDFGLIDAREVDEFNGIAGSSQAKHYGRIKGYCIIIHWHKAAQIFKPYLTLWFYAAGAINVPSNEILDTDGKLINDKDLKRLFDDKGVISSKKYIVYCNTGLQVGKIWIRTGLIVYFLKLILGIL